MEVVSVAAIRRSLTSLTTFDKVFGEGTFSRACMQEQVKARWEPLRGRILLSSCLPQLLLHLPPLKIEAPTPSPEIYRLLSSKLALFDHHVQSVVHSSFKAEIQTNSRRNHSNPVIVDDKTSCSNKQKDAVLLWMLKKKTWQKLSRLILKLRPFPLSCIHISCFLCWPNAQLCCRDEHLDLYNIPVAIIFISNHFNLKWQTKCRTQNKQTFHLFHFFSKAVNGGLKSAPSILVLPQQQIHHSPFTEIFPWR